MTDLLRNHETPRANDREQRLAIWAYATADRRYAHAQRLASYREEILGHFDALRRRLAVNGASTDTLDQLGEVIETVRGRIR